MEENITVIHFDPGYYFATLRIIGAIGLPINLFGLYCIVNASPKTMTKHYKMLLIIYQILYR